MSTIIKLTRGALLGLVPGFLLLAGCASSGTYRELVDDFELNQVSGYAAHETRPAGPREDEEARQTQPFLEEIESTLLESKRRWEARLADSGDGAPESNAYAELAKSPELDAKLAKEVELELLLGLVPELNPAVIAATEELRATLEQYPQAAYLEDILRQYNAFTKQLDTKVGPQRQKEMMAMQFPFPDTLALKGEIVTADVEIAEREAQIALRDARTAMRESYHTYLFVNDAIAVNRENQQLLQQMIEVAQAKIRAGTAKYNAVIMAQVELSKLADAIITLEEQRETVKTRINTMLSRKAEAPLGPPQPIEDENLVPELSRIYEIALEERQELQQERLRIDRMRTMIELDTRMTNPDASMGYSYFENRMGGDGAAEAMGDEGGASFMTRRDLDASASARFGQRNAYIQEIRSRVEAMESMLRAMEDRTRAMVKQEHFGMTTARRSIALYQQSLLPQAEQSLEAAGSSYRAGETDFLTFLDTQRTLLNFRLEEQRAWREFRTSQARLEQLAGGNLPREPFQLPTHAENETMNQDASGEQEQ